MKGLTITVGVDGPGFTYTVTEFDGGLKELQAAVGGLVEVVPTHEGVTMWCNEEGKYTGLPVNRLAMDVWIRWDVHRCMLVGKDWLAGSVVVTGGSDRYGNTTDLGAAERRWVLRVAADAGAQVEVDA